MKPTVTVLMSTYNGEKFIREQIDSILNQVGVNVKLVIRDDGSKDNTLKILDEYVAQNNNVELIRDGRNLGACQSFLQLMCKDWGTEYYSLADQDDIWDLDKIEIAINNIKNANNSLPVLYFSNLRIVDEKNNFCRLSHSSPYVIKSKYSFLSECLPTGCTVVYNDKLAEKLYNKVPQNCTMHDSWLYCVASAFGTCIYDFDPHINYRQHSGNVIGTAKKRLSLSTIKREIRNIVDYSKQPRFKNACELKRVYHSEISEDILEKLSLIERYKLSIKNTLKLFFDSDIDSESIHRRVRFKIKVLLRNI